MTRFVNTLFAEDFRHEVNGQYSLIGVFTGGITVEGFPLTFPKFCLTSFLSERSEGDPFAKVGKVYINDKEVAKFAVDEEAMLSNPANKKQLEDEAPGFAMAAFTSFSPLVMSEPGIISVRIEMSDGTTIPAGRFRVRAKT